jgi:hypothetical protein
MTRFSSELIKNVELEIGERRVVLRWYASSEYEAMRFYDELRRGMENGFVTIKIGTGATVLDESDCAK